MKRLSVAEVAEILGITSESVRSMDAVLMPSYEPLAGGKKRRTYDPTVIENVRVKRTRKRGACASHFGCVSEREIQRFFAAIDGGYRLPNKLHATDDDTDLGPE